MASPAWISSLPPTADAATVFPPCSDEEAFELRDLRVREAAAASVEIVERPEIVNAAVERCDVAGFTGQDGRADRLLVEGSRLRGVTWVSGMVQDALFDTVTGSDVSFRFSTLRRVVFQHCVLPELDFTEAVLDDVRLQGCDLRGARFHRAQVKQLRIEGCDLTGCTGAEALRGASIHPDDLLALGPSLAQALGISIG